MSSTFPTSQDNFINPTSANTLNSPDHAGQHSDVNDAVEAIETKVGTGASTPSTGAILIGTGSGISGWDTSPNNIVLDQPTLNTPTLTVNDNVFTVQDNSDTTKKLQLQLSGITTGTTRTLTVPDVTDTIVTLAATQTLTNKTLSAPVVANPTLTVDTVSEFTGANGVTVDGLNIKDSKLNTNNSVVTSNITDAAVTPAKWTNPYKFSVYHNATQAITTAGGAVAFNTELFDSNNNFTSNTYTAPFAGFYIFGAQTAWSATGSQTRIVLYLSVNSSGSTGTVLDDRSTGAAAFGASGSKLVQLSANDTVGIFFLPVGANTTLRAGPTNTVFWGILQSLT